jgi:predicted transcriptional regulator
MTSSHHESNDRNRRRYRSRNDIISELLTLALEGTTKTKLMYGAFLSYRQIQEYLPLLLENGFMVFDGTDQKYHTEQKGKDFLDTYKRIRLASV